MAKAIGICRFYGAFTVVKRQGECRSKTAGMHVSHPMIHSVLVAGLFSFYRLIDFDISDKNSSFKYLVGINTSKPLKLVLCCNFPFRIPITVLP